MDSVEQRRAAFTGVISASFVVIDLMRGLFSTALLEQVHIRIHDAGHAGDEQARSLPTAANLLFDSNRLRAEAVTTVAATAGTPGDRTHESSLDVGGRRWDLYFSARPGSISAVQRWLPWAVLLSGLAISLLLAGLVRSLQTSRARAVAWADRATADLRASEERLIEEQRWTRELLETIPIPIFFKATDGRYLGVNKAWEELFGLPRDSFIGKTVHDLYPHQPEIADRLHAMDQILWRSGGNQTYETAITTGQGKTLDTVYYKATYTNPDGSVAGLIGTIVDITERKATEQRFRALFDNAAVGIATVDLGGTVTDANQKFLDMLGYARTELVGQRIAEITVAENGGTWSALRRGSTGSDLPGMSTLESRMVRKDGSVIWVRRTISAICGKDGAPQYTINVVEDITESKQEELRRTMEYAVTRELAGEESLPDLFPKIIEIICRNMGWEFGLAWTWNHDQRALRYFTSWGADAPALQKFVADSMERAIRPVPGEQQGLIRRAYTSGEAVWISNITPAEGFRRAQLIGDAGLRGAFAFPLLRGSDVVGVMEFYHRNAHESEKTLIGSAQSIGHQIGQYMGRREAEEALKFVAAHDALTKLPNRMMFQLRLEHALALAQRGGSRLALLFIDLDHFKVINDTLGHEAGDTLLCEVAARLQGQLRASDTVSRLGGDEFVVLVENVADTASISDLARRLIEVLTTGFTLSGGEYHVTASIGASIYPDDGADAQTLLKHADIAMYRAKDQGRNRFLLYSA
jgi:diguanylate cyclase (GGDEF)-like protein/PAS domain S-box-containing protein